MPVGLPVHDTEPRESGEERRPDRAEQQARETTSDSLGWFGPKLPF